MAEAKRKVVVIGGGPAGMMAAGTAGSRGHEVILVEKNHRPGRKLMITGKGRCNITNNTDVQGLIAGVTQNGPFLFSAFTNLSSGDLITWLHERGLPTKVERGGRVFPASDKAVDVVDTMQNYLKENQVKIYRGVAQKIFTNKENLHKEINDKQQPPRNEEKDQKEMELDGENSIEKEKKGRNVTEDVREDIETEKKKSKKVKESKDKDQPKEDDDEEDGENDEKNVKGVLMQDSSYLMADSIIIATGGLSYPQTGSTGDGYEMARQLGHTITPLNPSLVPLETKESWVAQLEELSLRNVSLTVWSKAEQNIFHDQGEMLFTDFGISGPLALSASTAMKNIEHASYTVSIDLKPGLSFEQLDRRIQRDFVHYSRKILANSLGDLLPQKLIPVIINLSGIPRDKPVNQISKEEREKLALLLKDLRLNIKGFRPLEEAIITSGGVNTREITPSTMESRLVQGLFFAGEVIDVSAYTGGYNLQIAFSTGYTAGLHC